MSNIKILFKNTLLYGIGKSIQKFIGLFLLPFYAIVLGPEEFGILDTIGVSTYFLVALLNFGLDSASGRYFFAADSPAEKGKVLFTVFVLRLFTIIPCLILAIFSSKISFLLFDTNSYSLVVFLSIMMIPLNLLYSEQEHIFRYYFEPLKFNFISITKIISSVVFGLSLVVYLKLGVLGATIAAFISSLIFFLVSFTFFNHKRYVYQFSWYWAKKLLNYGYPLIGASAAIWFYSSSDRFIILFYKDLSEVGIYSIGAKFIQVLGLLNMAVQMSWGPHMIKIFEEDKDPKKLNTRSFLSKGWHSYLVISVCIVMLISIFSTDIILLLLSKEYLLASMVMPFLGYSKVLSQSIQMTTSGIFFHNKTKYFGIIIPLCAILNIALNFLFIPQYSFIGAAFSTFVVHIFQFIILFWISQKLFYVEQRILIIWIYLILLFFISIFVPSYELYYELNLPFVFKFGLLSIGLLIPFILKIISIKPIINKIKEIVLSGS